MIKLAFGLSTSMLHLPLIYDLLFSASYTLGLLDGVVNNIWKFSACCWACICLFHLSRIWYMVIIWNRGGQFGSLFCDNDSGSVHVSHLSTLSMICIQSYKWRKRVNISSMKKYYFIHGYILLFHGPFLRISYVCTCIEYVLSYWLPS